MKRMGILTGGGDAPALNALIRAARRYDAWRNEPRETLCVWSGARLSFQYRCCFKRSDAASQGQVFSREGDEIHDRASVGLVSMWERISRGRGLKRALPGPIICSAGRLAGERYGAEAVRLAARAKFDRMVALRAGKIVDIPLEEAIAAPKRVDVNDDAILTARGMGISFGDE